MTVVCLLRYVPPGMIAKVSATVKNWLTWNMGPAVGRHHILSVMLRQLLPRPLKEAIVTVGGVSREDVDPATMMSRKVPGLYFAGEVLDVDGPTGGYNLTLAFATARAAVVSVQSRLRDGGAW